MWRETELATSPFYLLARHWHHCSYVDNHWPLSEYISFFLTDFILKFYLFSSVSQCSLLRATRNSCTIKPLMTFDIWMPSLVPPPSTATCSSAVLIPLILGYNLLPARGKRFQYWNLTQDTKGIVLRMKLTYLAIKSYFVSRINILKTCVWECC
jgi:hypothetical protein